MVKPNEMMIGDYFLVGKDVKKYMFVASVNNSCILFDYFNNDGYLYESRREYINPIPITEDLLKGIGFYKGIPSVFAYKHEDLYRIVLYPNHYCSYNLEICYDGDDKKADIIEIRYLHELQQAVRLVTKKELTIEL